MYLLYSDESGTVNDASQRHFILAGFATFERQSYWLAKEIDDIANEINPADPGTIEFHGNPMYRGKGLWRHMPLERRKKYITRILRLFYESDYTNRVSLCAINKATAAKQGHNIVELSFAKIAQMFDLFLMRLYKKGQPERGILIFDKSTYETTLQRLATDFRTVGHQWGVLKNLAEVPLFLDSTASRLIQLADLIAYSSFLHYEKQDSEFFNIIKDKIDDDFGVTYGLYELL